MPGGDGTGPAGPGRGAESRPGKMGGPIKGGPGGTCVCPQCGTKVEHSREESCHTIRCPKCGTKMERA